MLMLILSTCTLALLRTERGQPETAFWTILWSWSILWNMYTPPSRWFRPAVLLWLMVTCASACSNARLARVHAGLRSWLAYMVTPPCAPTVLALTMTWKSEVAQVLARCFPMFGFQSADQGNLGVGALLHQLEYDIGSWLEHDIWCRLEHQKASSWKGYCKSIALLAAKHGHESCLRLLHELGGDAAACVAAPDARGLAAAHYAASHGRTGCLRVLHELGGNAAASLALAGATGFTPAHGAALMGQEGTLRFLHALGGDAAASLFAISAGGETPAYYAARNGCSSCFRMLHALGGDAAASVAAADVNGNTPAHHAACRGQEVTLRVLHELGGNAAASLVAANALGQTPADILDRTLPASADLVDFTANSARCLRLLYELGGEVAASVVTSSMVAASLVTASGRTRAHHAAVMGRGGCLRVLHALGGDAARSLRAVDARGDTPTHLAAFEGQEGCLRVLHELFCMTWDHQHLATLGPNPTLINGAGTETDLILQLRALRSLAWTQNTKPFDLVDLELSWAHGTPAAKSASPAAYAAMAGHTGCFRFIAEIGGAAAFLRYLRMHEHLIDSRFPCLLSDPTLLDLETKRAWLTDQLTEQLRRKVQAADSEEVIYLTVARDDMLKGLCEALGVHRTTGEVNAQAAGVDVVFYGEAAEGDGVRREWFAQTTKEISDPRRGLFISLDGGRTLQPNPEAGDHAPDHLAHFALLGRIVGLALHHCESLDVSLSAAFLKAVLGYPITVDDVALIDPEKCKNLRKMRKYSAKDLAVIHPGLSFEDDTAGRIRITSTDANGLVTFEDQQKFVVNAHTRQLVSIELKPGGANIEVTPDNVEEYLQLCAEYQLVGIIREQINAVRHGLGVFLNEALMVKLRACCTVAEIQLLLCGAPAINVDDWEASAEYRGGYSEGSDQVEWFWAQVRGMTPEEQDQLLFFCTGSSRAPATGFANLMGFHGAQHRFTIECDDRGVERAPAAATCFNTLKLPPYPSAEDLAVKLRLTFWAKGFHEAAVAT